MDKSIDNALNWGIIGTGRIAEAFAQALNHTESGYISGVASRNQDSSNQFAHQNKIENSYTCLLYTSPSPRDRTRSRMPSSA